MKVAAYASYILITAIFLTCAKFEKSLAASNKQNISAAAKNSLFLLMLSIHHYWWKSLVKLYHYVRELCAWKIICFLDLTNHITIFSVAPRQDCVVEATWRDQLRICQNIKCAIKELKTLSWPKLSQRCTSMPNWFSTLGWCYLFPFWLPLVKPLTVPLCQLPYMSPVL